MRSNRCQLQSNGPATNQGKLRILTFLRRALAASALGSLCLPFSNPISRAQDLATNTPNCLSAYAQAQFENETVRHYIQNGNIYSISYYQSGPGRDQNHCLIRLVGSLSDGEWKIEGNQLVKYSTILAGSKLTLGRRRGSSETQHIETPLSARKLLKGTAWNIEFPNSSNRGKTGMIFLFCKNNRWQVVPRNGGIGPQGTYQQSDGRLITKRDDGKIDQYRLNFGQGWVDLLGGSTPLRLHYHSQARC